MNKQNRYPGIRPFSSEDNRLFFGRSESIKRINRLFKLEKLIVLFGKSGLGKTSLVQAGAIPILQKEDLADGVEDFRFELVRFGAYHAGDEAQKGLTSETPVQRIRRAIAGSYQLEKSDLFKIVEDDQTPWMAAKALQLMGDARTIVLVLDQSEELFTWPQEEIDHVKEALQALLNQNVPDQVRRKLHRAARAGDLDYNQLMSPPDAKAMLVIRSDKLDSLDQLADVLPDIYNKRYELPPLDRLAATEAIQEPAQLAGIFSTPTFTYSDDCLNYILDFLSNTSDEKSESKPGGKFQERIEGFQLQLICQHAEFKIKEKVKAGETNIVLKKEDIGDLQEVTRSYYQRVLNGIQDVDARDKVQVLVEEGLIYEAGPDSRRLSLFDGLIESQYGVGSEQLEYLGNSRLLRRVALPEGGFSYEISHDSLLAPILTVKEVRKGVELQAEEVEAARLALVEKQERDAAESKERQRKRTVMYLGVVSVLSILALGGMGFAFVQSGRVEKEKQEALRQKNIADSLTVIANSLKGFAEDDADRAKSSEIKALEAKEKADSLMKVAVIDAQKMATLARDLDKAKSESDRLNRKVLANSLLGRFRWMRKLDPFELDQYSSRKFGEWKANGAGIEENFKLSPETFMDIEKSEIAFQGSSLDLNSRLYLIHEQLQRSNDELSQAVALSTLKQGNLSSETVLKKSLLRTPVSFDVLNQGPGTWYAIGYGNGKVEIRDEEFEILVDSLSESHLPDNAFSDGSNPVKSIAYSSDGKFLATGGADGWVHIYHADGDRRLINKIHYGNDWVRDLAFSPSGKELLIAGDLFSVKICEISPIAGGPGKSTNGQGDDRKNRLEYRVEVTDSIAGFEGYIYQIAFDESGQLFGTGGESGETQIWQKSEGGWKLLRNMPLPDYERVTKVFWEENTMFAASSYGILWKINPSLEAGWQKVHSYREDNNNLEPVFALESGNSDNWIAFDGANSLDMIERSSGGVTELLTIEEPIVEIFSDEENKEIVLVTQSGLQKITYIRKSISLELDDLVHGVNLPALNPVQKIKIGKLDQADIDQMQTPEKEDILEELKNHQSPGTLGDEFRAGYAQLTVSYLEDFMETRSSPEVGLESNFLQQVLVRLDLEVKRKGKFEKTPLFIASLENQRLTPISKWLYWAYRWRTIPAENFEMKRYFATLSYQAYPQAAWERILIETESYDLVVPSSTFFVGSDVNSLEFNPRKDELLFTTDVGFEMEPSTFLNMNPETGELDSPSRSKDTHNTGYVWGASYSPSGKLAASFGESEVDLIVWDTRKRSPIPGFPLVDDRFSQSYLFLSENTILMTGISRRELFLIYLPEKDNHPIIIPLISLGERGSGLPRGYYGDITDVERLSSSKIVVALSSGSILFATLPTLSSGSKTLDLDEIWKNVDEFQVTPQEGISMKLAYSKSGNKLVVSTGQVIYSYSLTANLLVNEESEMNSIQLIMNGEIMELESNSTDNNLVWRSQGELGVIDLSLPSQLVIKRASSQMSLFDVAISSDGSWVSSGSNDDMIRMYRTKDFIEVDLSWLNESGNPMTLTDRGSALKEELDYQFSEEFSTKFWSSISQ